MVGMTSTEITYETLAEHFTQRGAQSRMSKATKIPAPMLSAYASGARRVPADQCPEIERASGGRVRCEGMRPDEPWHRIPDALWPNPQGRPVLDFASRAECAPDAQAAEQGA